MLITDTVIDIQGELNNYFGIAKKIRNMTPFDYWFTYCSLDNPPIYVSQSGSNVTIRNGSKTVDIDTGKEIFAEQQFTTSQWGKLVDEQKVAPVLFGLMDCISKKLSSQMTTFESKHWIPVTYNKYSNALSALVSKSNCIVTVVYDPLTGLPFDLMIEDDSGIVRIILSTTVQMVHREEIC